MKDDQLTDAVRREIKEAIALAIAGLEAEITSLEAASRPVEPDNAIGRITRMEAMQARSISEASLGSARARLMRLQGTLTRVDAETYGICTDCGEPIPLKRLMLMPETGRCMACMSGRDA